jgi:hypothetical protein
MKATLLIVDDEPQIRRGFARSTRRTSSICSAEVRRGHPTPPQPQVERSMGVRLAC